MYRSSLRIAITVLTVITALVHLILGIKYIDFTFLLNGIGYLALLAALLFDFSFLADKKKWLHFIYMAYTIATILAWLLLNGNFRDPLGVGTKLAEVLLVVALGLHMEKAM